MPDTLPDVVDPWRMVQARRTFRGSLPVSTLPRLLEGLADDSGAVGYDIEFGTDEFGLAYLDLRVETGLSLICQRMLKPFTLPVVIEQRLGLIRDEAGESALPEHYEPLLVTDGQLSLRDVIEDELILALPVVALGPGEPIEEEPLTATLGSDAEERANPFAMLGQLKTSRH